MGGRRMITKKGRYRWAVRYSSAPTRAITRPRFLWRRLRAALPPVLAVVTLISLHSLLVFAVWMQLGEWIDRQALGIAIIAAAAPLFIIGIGSLLRKTRGVPEDRGALDMITYLVAVSLP